MERYNEPVNYLPSLNRYFFLKIVHLGEKPRQSYGVTGFNLGVLP
jgi:hypothetical protein